MIILPFFKFVLQSAEYHGLTVRQVCFMHNLSILLIIRFRRINRIYYCWREYITLWLRISSQNNYRQRFVSSRCSPYQLALSCDLDYIAFWLKLRRNLTQVAWQSDSSYAVKWLKLRGDSIQVTTPCNETLFYLIPNWKRIMIFFIGKDNVVHFEMVLFSQRESIETYTSFLLRTTWNNLLKSME